jgi:tyrosine-specific transport protein
MKKGIRGEILGKYQPEIHAYMTLVGTIVGAGIFGVPYVFSKVGVLFGVIYSAALGSFLTLMYLMFADAMLRVGESARLPGLAKKVLGARAGAVAAATSIIGFWAAMIAYLILGGLFLSVLFEGIVELPLIVWQLIFYGLCALIVARGLNLVGRAETLVTALLILVMIYFIARLAPHFELKNLTTLDARNLLLPYGVILFALTGTGAIPSVREMLKGREKSLPKVIFGASLSAVVLTAIFGAAVVAVSGQATTEKAVDGLATFLGPWVIKTGALFGLLAIATSFFSNGLYLRDIFRVDYRLTATLSNVLSLGIPVILFFLGAQEFIKIIGFAGAVFGCFEAIILSSAYLKARAIKKARHLDLRIPKWWAYAIITIFTIGLVATLASILV